MARTNNTQVEVEPVTSDATTSDKLTFTKDQLVKSKKYVHRRDALSALLEDGKSYSFDEVDNTLKQFDEGGKA